MSVVRMNSHVRGWVYLVVALVVAGSAWARTMAVPEQYVLMVPERFRLIQFGADISALCEVPLITYDSGALSEDGGLRLFSWSPSQKIWRPLDEASFSANVGEGRLGTVLLVGLDADIPKVLTSALTGTPVARIETLELAQVANALNTHLKFTSKQWKGLAAKHGLQLEDRNATKRKQGRYGRSNDAVNPVENSQSMLIPVGASPVEIMGAQGETVTLDEELVDVAPVAVAVPEVTEVVPVATEPEAVQLPADVPEAPVAIVAPPPVEKGVGVNVVPEVEVIEVAPSEPVVGTAAVEVEVEAETEDPAGVQGPELPAEK
jgi:hypothetical protein